MTGKRVVRKRSNVKGWLAVRMILSCDHLVSLEPGRCHSHERTNWHAMHAGPSHNAVLLTAQRTSMQILSTAKLLNLSTPSAVLPTRRFVWIEVSLVAAVMHTHQDPALWLHCATSPPSALPSRHRRDLTHFESNSFHGRRNPPGSAPSLSSFNR